MLSTLNQYQRVRKCNEKLLQELLKNNSALLNQSIKRLSTSNIRFAALLPFKINFDRYSTTTLQSFITERKNFDTSLISLAINSKADCINIIKAYIKKEEECYVLVANN